MNLLQGWHRFLIFASVDLWSCLSRFSNVYFVDASTAETINADLISIAVAKGAGESTQDALEWLAGLREEWLLLLDNADDPALNLRDYFPRCSHGNILITSRNHETSHHASDGSGCPISAMDPGDARNMLLRISGLQKKPTKKMKHWRQQS